MRSGLEGNRQSRGEPSVRGHKAGEGRLKRIYQRNGGEAGARQKMCPTANRAGGVNRERKRDREKRTNQEI